MSYTLTGLGQRVLDAHRRGGRRECAVCGREFKPDLPHLLLCPACDSPFGDDPKARGMGNPRKSVVYSGTETWRG